MEKLREDYNKNGYEFQLVERENDVAIYSQIDPASRRVVAYEVFEVLKKQATTVNGSLILARETTPSNEQWGKFGFTVHQFSDAKAKQAQLLMRLEKRHQKQSST